MFIQTDVDSVGLKWTLLVTCAGVNGAEEPAAVRCDQKSTQAHKGFLLTDLNWSSDPGYRLFSGSG